MRSYCLGITLSPERNVLTPQSREAGGRTFTYWMLLGIDMIKKVVALFFVFLPFVFMIWLSLRLLISNPSSRFPFAWWPGRKVRIKCESCKGNCHLVLQKARSPYRSEFNQSLISEVPYFLEVFPVGSLQKCCKETTDRPEQQCPNTKQLIDAALRVGYRKYQPIKSGCKNSQSVPCKTCGKTFTVKQTPKRPSKQQRVRVGRIPIMFSTETNVDVVTNDLEPCTFSTSIDSLNCPNAKRAIGNVLEPFEPWMR